MVPDQERDAARYRWLRDKAMKGGDLEAFVALSQLDYIPTQERFDACIDAAMRLQRHPDQPRQGGDGEQE